METNTSGARPVSDDPGRAGLIAVGDFLAITAIVGAGLYEHHGTAAFASPAAAIDTLAPFLIGWFVCAGIAGLYRGGVLTDVETAVRLTTVTALAAVNVGLVLRSSPYFDGGVTWPFGLVMAGSVLLVVVPWRAAVARWFFAAGGS